MPEIIRDPLYREDNLIWIDMEMTGLQPEVNRVIEVAAVITDSQLNIIHEGPVVAVHQDARALAKMDSWNTQTHGKSGLTQRVIDSVVDEEAATDIFLDVFRRFVPKGKSPMCGNTIGQDRRFMSRWMPRLEAYFHYRSIDVSTVKELVKRWKPEVKEGLKKATRHEALSDILDSIEELKYYRREVFRI